jgi:hypothetical protein
MKHEGSSIEFNDETLGASPADDHYGANLLLSPDPANTVSDFEFLRHG